MALEVRRAESQDELEAVFRLRYDVYVEEMGRYSDLADHERRLLSDPEDEHSWVFYGLLDNEVVATARLTWGSDGFSERQRDQYRLDPFLAQIPPSLLGVGERAMVKPEFRGTPTLNELLDAATEMTEHLDVRVMFGACEPHLLSLYLGMGQRTYAERNINSPEAGYLVPLISFIPDEQALVGVGGATDPSTGAPGVPPVVADVLAGHSAVRSGLARDTADYWHEIHETLTELDRRQVSAFDGFTDDEAQRCVDRSNIIECSAGDRVLKAGGAARNIFVVLDGKLEVRDPGGVTVGVLAKGDAFGEMAFLLERPRTHDVFAGTDETVVLSLSEGRLRKMIAEDAEVAAKLLFNVSKMLCVRLIKAECTTEPR